MNTKIILAAIFMLAISELRAQYEFYPSVFGRHTYNGGSARFASIGGAGTALGADFGSSYVNPAGLGMYRKSEFSFTPDFGFSGSNTDFIQSSGERSNLGSFGLANFGIALSGIKDDLNKDNWRGGTFSIGFNRLNNFHNRINFSGLDERNSMADYFVNQANGTSAEYFENNNNPFDANSEGINSLGSLAYYSYLVEPYFNNSSLYYHGITDESVLKEGTYTTRGNQSQWNLSYGSNFMDKLYLGLGLGISSINYREELSYSEYVGYNSGGSFVSVPDTVDYFTFNDYNKIKGTGLNMRFGYLYKISDAVRIGSTITTPTYYWMNQEFSSDLSVTYAEEYTYFGDPLGTQAYSTNQMRYRFTYISPLRFSTGLALFAGKAGFISGDIEYVPYNLSSISGRGNDASLNYAEKLISNNYKNVLNLRVGGELRLDLFKLRGGFAYLPTPFNAVDNINRNVLQFSGGAGVRVENFFFDIGIVNSRFQSSYSPYTLPYENTASASSKNSRTNVLMTIGFYFE